MTQRRSPLEFSSQCRRGDLLPYDSHDEPSLPTAVNAQICKQQNLRFTPVPLDIV